VVSLGPPPAPCFFGKREINENAFLRCMHLTMERSWKKKHFLVMVIMMQSFEIGI